MKLSENPHLAPGQWYRGNLHTHTTRSDGKLAPSDVVAWYHKHGYDFVALTDHWHTTSEGAENAPITVLLGQEIDVTPPGEAQSLHIVAIGLNERPDLPEGRPAQGSIDVLLQMGATCFLAHPYWSGLAYDEMIGLEGISAVEIYNGSATDDNGKTHSLVHWDDLLHRGKYWPAIATDDAHSILVDGGRGWVYVKARENTPDTLVDALRRGQFYSSTGPTIDAFDVSGDTVTVRCSPVARINLVSDRERGQVLLMNDQPLTEATMVMRKVTKYIRLEVIDELGRGAWTNAFEI